MVQVQGLFKWRFENGRIFLLKISRQLNYLKYSYMPSKNCICKFMCEENMICVVT